MAERLGTQLQSGGLEQSIHTGLLGSGLFGGASLDLNFAVTKNVGPLVTFTRASSGTFVDSAGVLQTATTNLLLRSEEIGTSPWGTNNGGSVTYTANAITSPVGSITADRVTATADFAGPNQFASATLGLPYTFSFYIKAVSAGVKDQIRIELFSGRFAQFRISTLAFSGVNAGITATSAQAVGDGWVRVVLTTLAPSTESLASAVYANTDADFYLWGVQLEQSSTVGEYIPTTSAINSAPRFDHAITTSRTNLLTWSEDFSNAAWGPVAGTVTANAETSPANTLTADKLIAINGGPQGQLVQGATITSGATVTGSVYAKAGGFDRVELVLLASNNTTPYGRSTFNPNTGVITTAAFTANGGTNASSAVQALTNGWYRFSVTVTYPAVTSAGMRFAVFNSDSANGDGVKGVFLWGAQLEQSSTVGEYIPTTTAPVTVNTTESLGLLVEEQRTNSIRNNTMVGAVAGTPGTLPTNWSFSGAGTNIEVVGTGSENGINYIDVRFSGTATNTNLNFEATTSASPSQTWAASCYFKLISGTFTGNWRLTCNEFASGNNFLRTGFAQTFTPTNASLSTQRVAGSFTTGASTATISVLLNCVGAATSIDFTIRIGLPQLEQGAFATSVIPTTTAAATRAADVASITGSAFSSWYRQDEGTVFASAGVQDFTQTNSPRLFSIDRGDISSNFIAAVRGSSTRRLDYSVFADGTGQAVGLNNGIAPAANTTANGAWVYKANDFIGAVNGVLTNSDTSGSAPTLLTTLGIGMQGNATLQYNGTIKRLAFFPQRLSNSTLQTITQ